MEYLTLWFTENLMGSGVPVLFLIATVGIALALLLMQIFAQRRMIVRLGDNIQALEKKIFLISSGSLGFGQRVLALEKKIRSLQDQQQDIRQQDLEFSYSQAQKLIEQGLDSRAVAASSGLSVSEVDLMQMLYGRASQHHVA
ncbi:DUF2802 domain-containing protein [Teredinibacter franksiae]|uniref:DUF2802 domain-containing protein n=1 Tax=Teredinibacter franksiae TaxID=2761453 RepID=UPI0016275E3A|nr:DUF2802 domain-containing protein [Teredinibacter franksiae]